MSQTSQTIDIDDPRWAGKGSRGFSPRPFEKTRWAILSFPKGGKSTLVQSDPDSLILNFEAGCGYAPDCRGFVVPDPSSGQVCDWSLFSTTMDQLLEEGRAGKPAFKRVVFDTFDTFVTMLDGYLTEKVNVGRRKKGRPTINHIGERDNDGGGWRQLAYSAYRTLMDLEEAGYGWTILSHLRKTKTPIKIGNEVKEFIEATETLTPTLQYLLGRCVDYKCRIEKNFKVERPLVERNGKMIPDPKSEPVYTPQFTLKFHAKGESDAGDAEDSFGMRVPLPQDILLPKVGGWPGLGSLYETSCETVRAEATS